MGDKNLEPVTYICVVNGYYSDVLSVFGFMHCVIVIQGSYEPPVKFKHLRTLTHHFSTVCVAGQNE